MMEHPTEGSPNPSASLPQQPQQAQFSYAQRSQHLQQPQQSPYSQNSHTPETWSPIVTPPPAPHPAALSSGQNSANSSFNSSYNLGLNNENGAPPGYSSVGLGISAQRANHRRGLSSDTLPLSQESPGFMDTPRTPYQSHDYLLGTPPSRSTHRFQSDYSPYGQQSPPSPPRRRGKAWDFFFHKGWMNSSWIMYALLILGIIFAVSHHVFYSGLAGKPADDQLKMIRFGTLLSYLSKSSLVSAVIFAYRQQIWATVKRKNLRLRGIDNLFAAVDDLTALASWELVKKARVALALAVLVWLYPLTVILTPATLTVGPLTETLVTQCNGVRTLNFESEKTKNWRDAIRINDFPLISLSLWNSSLGASSEVRTPFNETFFDYWTGTSLQTNLYSTLSAYSDKAVKRDDVSIEVCGAGWNCSYVIEFTAPGYKCEQLARGRDDNTAKLSDMKAPFNTKDLLPDGKYGYVAHTTLGEYSSVQIDAHPGGAPTNLTDKDKWPKNIGAFRTEPVLWIGHSDLADPSKPMPKKDDDRWLSGFVPTIFRCEHYFTHYKVQFNHTLSDQAIKVLNRTYLRPVVDTKFEPGVDANDGTRDNTTATPESNYVMPLDTENYRLTAAYHSLGTQLRYYINGSISFEPSAIANTEALKTQLINKTNYLVVSDFQQRIQKFYENIVFSLFGNPQFLVLTWAASPNERAGRANSSTANDPRLLHPCTKTRTTGAYMYNARDLWLVYSFAVVTAIAGVFFGALALVENNHHVRDIRVSSIVAATRAPCLQDLPWTKSQWGEVPPEIREMQMGYGMVVEKHADDPTQQNIMYGFAPVEVLETRTTGRAYTMASSLKSPLHGMVARFKGRR
ncbi:hypothetical protein B0T16DRAFT_355591 [Cercophora newfieldiana]|uniref:Formylmethionine deformylase-like protein n=1 Tax=Cercophora newfieldiana TaxID=92897 RepID=A0AA39Y0T1_9PEZI|nr:hypothetical protein B0T16DRAFT_355591 [Cercophora newfieldiana]